LSNYYCKIVLGPGLPDVSQEKWLVEQKAAAAVVGVVVVVVVVVAAAAASVVVVVVIAQRLFSYRQLFRLRKSATVAGSSHKSCTVSCVGLLWQLNRCSTECGATPHSGQTSDMPLVMRAL